MGGRDELPVEGPIAIVESISPERSLWSKHVVHVVFAGELDGSLEGCLERRGRARASPVLAGRARRARAAPPDPRASSGTSGRAIPASTSAPAGRSEAPGGDGRRANGRGRRRRRAPGARARRRVARAARSSPPVACARAQEKEQVGGSQGLRGAGAVRVEGYVPRRARPGSPRVPRCRRSRTRRRPGRAARRPRRGACAPRGSRSRRSSCPVPLRAHALGQRVSDHARVPGHGLVWKEPHALEPGPVPPAIPAAEQLIAAAGREERDAVLHGLPGIASPRAERSGVIIACSRSWPPPT